MAGDSVRVHSEIATAVTWRYRSRVKRSFQPIRCALAAAVLLSLACESDGPPETPSQPEAAAAAAKSNRPAAAYVAVAPDASVDELVAPIALYPDPLLAIVLPASTYPLDVVQADRFLDRLAGDKTLQPDPACTRASATCSTRPTSSARWPPTSSGRSSSAKRWQPTPAK